MLYKLKVAAKRGALLSTAAFVAVAAYLPAPAAFADALNPLTDRSLTLSSSSPGWDYKDGSGNGTYAVPGSGANGQKTGNTFDFKVSTTTTSNLKAMTFQYCTGPAGDCHAPGDNGYSGSGPYTRNGDSATTSDLNVVTSSPAEVGSSDFSTIVDGTNGNIKQTPQAGINFDAYYSKDSLVSYPQNTVAGNFIVYAETSPGTWTQSTGWTMTANNKESGSPSTGPTDKYTGKNNYIVLTNSGTGFASGTRVKVVFFATDNNYITNPGDKEFFVKINTYSNVNLTTPSNPSVSDADVIDGGVTVANVMNHSISIQTKVLETMEFSVGTVDPNTLESGAGNSLVQGNGSENHGPCDRILTAKVIGQPVNVLKLGDQTSEDSLRTDTTYSTHSYWRLSSNSSAGATVYYSGMTLSNTVGDKINAIGPNKSASIEGSEQFGLAIANENSGNRLVDYTAEDGTVGSGAPGKVFENGADFGLRAIDPSVATDVGANPSYHAPQLAPLAPTTNYSDGNGPVNGEYGTITNTKFAFDPASNLIPVPIASEGNQVVDCVTAKMRYIANIAATTPAGIYTTKVNYIAAPQY